MDKLSLEAASIFIVLLPGFISAWIINALCVRPKQSEFEKVLAAALNTFAVIVVYALAVGKFPVLMEASANGESTQYQLIVERFPLAALIGVALIWGLLVCFCEQHDWPFALLRRLQFTTRTSRSSLWDDAFSTYGHDSYVQVELSDGRSLVGYPRKFSDDTEETALFLEDAAWVDANGEAIPIIGGGILLTKTSGISNLCFLDAKKE